MSGPEATFGQWIGTTTGPCPREVSARDIHRVFMATAGVAGDDARRSPRDEAHAVPTWFCPDPIVTAKELGLEIPRFCAHHIDGGSEWEIDRVAELGERLTLEARIADIDNRPTRDGRPMVFTVIEVSAHDAAAMRVGVARGTVIDYGERI